MYQRLKMLAHKLPRNIAAPLVATLKFSIIQHFLLARPQVASPGFSNCTPDDSTTTTHILNKVNHLNISLQIGIFSDQQISYRQILFSC